MVKFEHIIIIETRIYAIKVVLRVGFDDAHCFSLNHCINTSKFTNRAEEENYTQLKLTAIKQFYLILRDCVYVSHLINLKVKFSNP